MYVYYGVKIDNISYTYLEYIVWSVFIYVLSMKPYVHHDTEHISPSKAVSIILNEKLPWEF